MISGFLFCRLRFCVMLQADIRNSSACVDVTVTPGSPPQLVLGEPQELQNPNDIVVLEASVCIAGYGFMEWSIVEAIGNTVLDMSANCLTDLTLSKTPVPSCKQFSLVCGGLTEDSTYTFRLTASITDSDGEIIKDSEVRFARV